MNQSETIAELAAALCKAQADMGGAVKDAKNPFFKSTYADLASVIKAIKQPCCDNGLSYIQMPISTENRVGVTTRLLHSSGEWIDGEYTLPMVKMDPQAAGSAITYARRYALASLFAIPQVDSDAEDAMLRGQVAGEIPLDVLESLNSAGSLHALADIFKDAWAKYPQSRKELTVIKDLKKKELTEVAE